MSKLSSKQILTRFIQNTGKMEEVTYRFWDVVIKALGFVAIVISIFFNGCQYSDSTQREYQKEYWAKQLESCEEVAESLAAISLKSKDNEAMQEDDDLKVFQYYIGKNRLYLSSEALDYVQNFGLKLNSCLTERKCSTTNFTSLVMGFVEICRRDISNYWDIPLEKLGKSAYRDDYKN